MIDTTLTLVSAFLSWLMWLLHVSLGPRRSPAIPRWTAYALGLGPILAAFGLVQLLRPREQDEGLINAAIPSIPPERLQGIVDLFTLAASASIWPTLGRILMLLEDLRDHAVIHRIDNSHA